MFSVYQTQDICTPPSVPFIGGGGGGGSPVDITVQTVSEMPTWQKIILIGGAVLLLYNTFRKRN